MTKLIKKKDCKFKWHRIVKDDELIGIPSIVWMQLNKLEVMCQQWCYLKGQPAYQAAPSLDGWVRESDIDKQLPYIDMPDTPVGDARVAEAMAFMFEVDRCADVAKVNEMVDRFSALIMWCKSKKFIEGDCTKPIDTPRLGNPLELTPEAIVEKLSLIVQTPIVFED